MNLLGTLSYIVANFVIFLMLACMLFSTFHDSSHRFRVVVGILAIVSLVCVFYGVELLLDVLTHKIEFGEFAIVAWCQVAQSLALAFVLVAMRVRQIRNRLHLHPRQRCVAPHPNDDDVRFAP